jgi:hypothetical protein
MDECFKKMKSTYYPWIVEDTDGFTNFYYYFLRDLEKWIDELIDFTIKKYKEVGKNISKIELQNEIENHILRVPL